MSKRFESIKKGVKEAIKWKKGKTSNARVRTYTPSDIENIRKKIEIKKKTSSN